MTEWLRGMTEDTADTTDRNDRPVGMTNYHNGATTDHNGQLLCGPLNHINVSPPWCAPRRRLTLVCPEIFGLGLGLVLRLGQYGSSS